MKDEEIKINKDELLAMQLMESMDEASDEALVSLDDEGCAHACKDLMIWRWLWQKSCIR